MSRILSALALCASLLSPAMAGDDLVFDVFSPIAPAVATLGDAPPADTLDWGVFDPMPVVGDAVTSDMFDVFSRGKTITIQPANLEPYPAKSGGYPLRTTRWTGLPKDIPGAVNHLATAKDHAGKFDFAWLATLSWDELDSLHADAHEGCVSPSAKLAKAIVPAPPKVSAPAPVQSSCAWTWDGRQWVWSCRR